jgi:hypothetical protein
MELLTDDEIHEDYKALRGDKQPRYIEIYRAAEAAILAKLGEMELPEPAMKHYERDYAMQITGEKSFYTADQLHQAYAQGFARGAAAQLAEKPTAWVYPHRLGHRELTFTDQAPIELNHPHFAKSTPLYTRREA